MSYQTQITIQTQGRGTTDITDQINKIVYQQCLSSAMCNLFIQHTSASLIICENADPTVREDLETFMAQLVPDGDAMFKHTDEGPDDMPAHIRNILTQTSLNIPIVENKLALGTWQGIYLWEHRTAPHLRKVLVSLYGN